jgi:hypothetical protein
MRRVRRISLWNVSKNLFRERRHLFGVNAVILPVHSEVSRQNLFSRTAEIICLKGERQPVGKSVPVDIQRGADCEL